MPPSRRTAKRKWYAIAYHGNYVGPGWSAGKYQDSVSYSKVQPIDDFDRTAMVHDAAYARGKHLAKADARFYNDNIGKGIKRSLAALAVGAQGKLRESGILGDSLPEKNIQMTSVRRKINFLSPKRSPKRSRSGSIASPSSAKKRKVAAKFVRNSSVVPYLRPKYRPYQGSSKSAGVIRRIKRKRLLKLAPKGYRPSHQYTLEFSGNISPQHCGFLLHHTHPVRQLNGMTAMAVVRQLFQMCSFSFLNWDHLSPVSGHIDLLYYKSAATPVSTMLNTSFTGGITSFETLANNLKAVFSSIFLDDTSRDPVVHLISMNITSTGHEQYVNLRPKDFYINVRTKSSLKFQNRSKGSLGSEADEVDNVPLTGIIADLTGSGTVFRDYTPFTDQCLVADQSTGTHYFYDDVNRPWMEPLQKTDIKNCKKYGKIRLEPGYIKTSVLVASKSFTLDTLFKWCSLTKQTEHARVPVGKSRLIMLEKMMAINTIEEPAMSIFFENNTLFNISTKYKPSFRPVANFYHQAI